MQNVGLGRQTGGEVLDGGHSGNINYGGAVDNRQRHLDLDIARIVQSPGLQHSSYQDVESALGWSLSACPREANNPENCAFWLEYNEEHYRVAPGMKPSQPCRPARRILRLVDASGTRLDGSTEYSTVLYILYQYLLQLHSSRRGVCVHI